MTVTTETTAPSGDAGTTTQGSDATEAEGANAALGGEGEGKTGANSDAANAALSGASNTGDGSNADDAGDSADGKNSDGGEGGEEESDAEKGDGEADPLAWAEGSNAQPELLEVANPILDEMGLTGDQKKEMLDLYTSIEAQKEAEFIGVLNKGFEDFTKVPEYWDAENNKVTDQVLNAYAALKEVSPEAKAFIESQAKYGSVVNKGLADIAMLVAKHNSDGGMREGTPNNEVSDDMYPNTKF